MNAREEAGKIYRSLQPYQTSKLIFIKGGSKRRHAVVAWLKFYGADAVSSLHIGGRWVYEFRKTRSMGSPIKNPPSKSRIRIAKAAYKISHALYKHFKGSGVPQAVIDRISPSIRPYVVYTLELNGIKIVKKNPFLKSSQVWKANKRRIFSNWRKKPFIREKYNYRLTAYAKFWDDRYMNSQEFDVDLKPGTIAREIYSKA